MIIDIHPHVISSDAARYPNAPVGGHQSDWSRERPVSVEQMMVAMDQAGITKSALVQASTCYGHDNSYIADAVAAHPDRFTGVFSVDVLAPDAPEKIRYWVRRNLTGMRLFTAGSTMPNQADWVDDPRSFPAWECASELKIPVCMQMTVKALPRLVRMLERFPKIRVILDHLAKPTLSDGPPYSAAASIFRLADYQNLYLKLTPRTVSEAQNGKASHATFFPLLLSKFAASRIAWGSNYPASEGTLPELLKISQTALSVLPAEDRDWIFAGTALTLYPVLAGN
jgi:predicted TIM-barrel fold metal-dependent hydrolase